MTTAPPRFMLLATDLDGSLLDQTGPIHERDRRAIAELLQRGGVAVTIVTASSDCTPTEVLGRFGVSDCQIPPS